MPPRRLTVLASLDVAGFTRLIEQDERGTLADLARIRRTLLRPTLADPWRQPVQDHGRRCPHRVPERRGRGRMGDRVPDRDGGAQCRERADRERPRSGWRSPTSSSRATTASARRWASSSACSRRRRRAASPSPIRCAGSSSRTSPRVRPHRVGRLQEHGRAVRDLAVEAPGDPPVDAEHAASRSSHCRKRRRLPRHARERRRRPRSSPSRHPGSPRTRRRSVLRPAVDRRARLRQHVGRPGGGIPRRRHRRGDHRDAVAHPRLHRHRAQLGLCLQGPAVRRARDVARARRPLRPRREPAQGGRPRAHHRPAHRRRHRRPSSGPTATTASSTTSSTSRTRSPSGSPARCARRSAPPRSRWPSASGRKTSPPTTWCSGRCRISGRIGATTMQEAIRLLDRGTEARSAPTPGRAAFAAWARAQHVVYNWIDRLRPPTGPRAAR